MFSKKSSFRLLAVAALALAGVGVAMLGSPQPVQAQASGAVQAYTPMTRDLPTLKTFTAQGAGVTTSADQSGFNVSRVVCVYNQTTATGVPSTTFSIQNKDAASGLYYNLIISPALLTSTTYPVFLAAGAGISSSTNLSAPLPIANRWRVSATVGGTGTPTVTGTIGCSVQ